MTRGLEVLDPGVLSLVQDDGRPGLAHLGVPRSGWLDAGAARLANRLVGNEPREDSPEAAVLECLGGGLVLRSAEAVTVAVTGAPCPVRVGARPAPHAEAVTVPAGVELALGRPVLGARSYLAVAGGIAADPVLGSRATDTLSGLGPPRLEAGELLPVGVASGPARPADGLAAVAARWGGPVELRVAPGPREDWFEAGTLAALATSTYRVAAEADRVGIRLDGPALMRADRADAPTELPSEGVVLGSVQVPADGRPLVFLRDHPTTGGYPVVAVVLSADLDRCAQLRPGDEVSFRRA